MFLKKHDNVNICCIHCVPVKHSCLHSFKNKLGFPGGSDSKESACDAGDPGLIPELGRSPAEGNGNPPQCSYLENSMDRGAWWTIVHGVTKSRIRLRRVARRFPGPPALGLSRPAPCRKTPPPPFVAQGHVAPEVSDLGLLRTAALGPLSLPRA